MTIFFLEPAFGASQSCGFDAICSAQFADCFRQIIADRALGQVQGVGDVLRGEAFAGAPQDLAFAFGEGVGFSAPGFGG